jgi:Flp pilus assembly protein TadD
MLELKRKANLFDVVELAEDLPEYGVKRGECGTVVEVLDDPSEAYILEFANGSDSPRLAYWVRPDQIVNSAKEAFERGSELMQRGRVWEAVLEFRRAAKVQPNYVGVLHNSIVKSFEGTDDWQRRVTAMRVVLRVAPDYQIARDNLAIAFMNYGVEKAREGDLAASGELYTLALSVGPSVSIADDLRRNIAAVRTGLGMRAHEEGDLERTVVHMMRACEVYPSSQTQNNLNVACASLAFDSMDKGNVEQAIEWFERAQDGGLATPRLLNDYAVALASRARVDEATIALESALEIEPGNETLKQNLRIVREGVPTGVTIGKMQVMTYPASTDTRPVFVPPPAPSDRSYIAA